VRSEVERQYRNFEVFGNPDKIILGGETQMLKNPSATELLEQRYQDVFIRQNLYTGYTYHHSAVLAFDDQGKYLWDRAYKLKDGDHLHLIPSENTHVHEGRYGLPLVVEQDFFQLELDQELGIQVRDRQELYPPFEKFDPRNRFRARLMPWYDRVYLISGYRSEQVGKDLQSIFFIRSVRSP
jgi:hypothetical protein